jgi:hypothetical protein
MALLVLWGAEEMFFSKSILSRGSSGLLKQFRVFPQVHLLYIVKQMKVLLYRAQLVANNFDGKAGIIRDPARLDLAPSTSSCDLAGMGLSFVSTYSIKSCLQGERCYWVVPGRSQCSSSDYYRNQSCSISLIIAGRQNNTDPAKTRQTFQRHRFAIKITPSSVRLLRDNSKYFIISTSTLPTTSPKIATLNGTFK